MDHETRLALARLANADERTGAAEIRWLIREAAIKRGLWTPKPLMAVSARAQDQVGRRS